MLKAILFDWGHTLTEEIDISERMDVLLKPYSLTWEKFYPLWKKFYHLRSKGNIKNDKDMFRQIEKVLQRKNMPLKKIRDIIILDSHIIPNKNINIVKEIKKDYKVGLITNFVYDWLERALKIDKIDNLFDVIVVSSKAEVRKPSTEMFYTALKSLLVEPMETIFVSDGFYDLISAKECGIKIIWLDKENKNKQNKKKKKIVKLFQPDAIAKDLTEVIPIIKKMENLYN
jgi:HAD superfamily hydrolase (TIGR01549 family)